MYLHYKEMSYNHLLKIEGELLFQGITQLLFYFLTSHHHPQFVVISCSCEQLFPGALHCGKYQKLSGFAHWRNLYENLFQSLSALWTQNLLSIIMFFETETEPLSYSIPHSLPCYKCFPKHLSIPAAGSGALFDHIDGSVEADRALFHTLKWGSLQMTGKQGGESCAVSKH